MSVTPGRRPRRRRRRPARAGQGDGRCRPSRTGARRNGLDMRYHRALRRSPRSLPRRRSVSRSPPLTNRQEVPPDVHDLRRARRARRSRARASQPPGSPNRSPSRPPSSPTPSPGATSPAAPRPAPARRWRSASRSSSTCDRRQRRRPTALVLAPTRELAEQIAAELRPLARARRHEVVSVYGGVGYGAAAQGARRRRRARRRLPRPARGPPRRCARSASQDVTQVVVDEADRMSDMGFLPGRPADPRADGRRAPGPAVLGHARRRRRQAGRAPSSAGPSATRSGRSGPDMTLTRHAFWSVDRVDRPELTADVVRQLGSTMVFCRTRHGADRLARQLDKLGVKAAPIHGGRSQPQRDRALQAFQTGSVAALVATDVAARGVHVDDVAGRRPLRPAGRRLDVRPPLGPHRPGRRVRRRRVVRRARCRDATPRSCSARSASTARSPARTSAACAGRRPGDVGDSRYRSVEPPRSPTCAIGTVPSAGHGVLAPSRSRAG